MKAVVFFAQCFAIAFVLAFPLVMYFWNM